MCVPWRSVWATCLSCWYLAVNAISTLLLRLIQWPTSRYWTLVLVYFGIFGLAICTSFPLCAYSAFDEDWQVGIIVVLRLA